MTSKSLPPSSLSGDSVAFSRLPLSFAFIPPSVTTGMQRGLSSQPLGILLSWDSVISLPLFQFQFQCPPLASQSNNIGGASKASLSLYPSLLLCPSLSTLNIFQNSYFFFFRKSSFIQPGKALKK